MKINDRIPDFKAEAYHNNEIKKIKFSDYNGKWLVLIFYPADFTFVCPTELEEAAGLYEEFKNLNAEILSISTDTAFSHKAWHDTSDSIKKINYPMVADPTGEISKAFKTYIDEEGLSLRGTFIIDPDGVLKSFEINDNNIGRNAKETLRKLQAAIFTRENPGQVCPARWEPGRDTLKPGVDLIGKI